MGTCQTGIAQIQYVKNWIGEEYCKWYIFASVIGKEVCVENPLNLKIGSMEGFSIDYVDLNQMFIFSPV